MLMEVRVSVAVITGAAGLVGSESVRHFSSCGLDVVGIDNDMRRYFFGDSASVESNRNRLEQSVPGYCHHALDIRDQSAVDRLFSRHGSAIALVVHAAAQPSHDWAASEPVTDFSVNAVGTLNLLEATRRFAPDATFIHTSTNKVYGDTPNRLPLIELESRWEIPADHAYANGIREDMPIDRTLHSLFGASKLAADVLVQEYGLYFGLKTACFRCGCLTGPFHAGAELHGFLSYLMRCVVSRSPYTVYGYQGKQVRDNLHCADLVRAFACFFDAPRHGEVYNLGGGRFSHLSMREAISLCEQVAGEELQWRYVETHRRGDHIWWVSDNARFSSHYPNWQLTIDAPAIIRDLHAHHLDRSPAQIR